MTVIVMKDIKYYVPIVFPKGLKQQASALLLTIEMIAAIAVQGTRTIKMFTLTISSIRVCSMPNHSRIRICIMPNYSRTRICSMPNHSRTHLCSMPNHSRTRICSMPNHSRTHLCSMPKHLHSWLTMTPYKV